MAHTFTARAHPRWAVETSTEMVAGGAVFGFTDDVDNSSSDNVLGL